MGAGVGTWWVNQGQTYADERRGSYLWAPKRNAQGKTFAHWQAMADVREGDVVLHYAQKHVRGLSRALGPAYDAEQPIALRATEMWDDDGRRVDVDHLAVPTLVARDTAVALGPNEAPFTVVGTVKQGYLFAVTTAFARALVEAMARAPDDVFGDRTAPVVTPTSAPPLATVPLEQHSKRVFGAPGSPAYVASKREADLVQAFLAREGLPAMRRRYVLDDGTTLYADLWDEERRWLVEAKGAATRAAVREAIGQLADYAVKEPEPVRKVLLLPEAPADDLLVVLRSQDITVIWREGDSWRRSPA